MLFAHLSDIDRLTQDPNSAMNFLMLTGQGGVRKSEPFFTNDNRRKAEILVARFKNLILDPSIRLPVQCKYAFFDDVVPNAQSTTATIKEICLMTATLFNLDKRSLFTDLEQHQRSHGGSDKDKHLLRRRHENLLAPETISGTMRLTDHGRRQIVAGERKCTKTDIRYMGEELYRPVTNLENELLVRIMVYLTERFETPFSMRPLASYPVLFVMGVCFLAVWTLFFLLHSFLR